MELTLYKLIPMRDWLFEKLKEKVINDLPEIDIDRNWFQQLANKSKTAGKCMNVMDVMIECAKVYGTANPDLLPIEYRKLFERMYNEYCPN